MSQQELGCRQPAITHGPWSSIRSPFAEPYNRTSGGFENDFYAISSANYSVGVQNGGAGMPIAASGGVTRQESSFASESVHTGGLSSVKYSCRSPAYSSYKGSNWKGWDPQGRYSPTASVDRIIAPPPMSAYYVEMGTKRNASGEFKNDRKKRPQRRYLNWDEFDGPHQLLQRPPPGLVVLQNRELPRLPTNLPVQEQDLILNQVNDRLSQRAFDFVAKYQFPIPLTQHMRPIERPKDREWTEWVFLLKRLATKRRIPARVLYNGQIKQLVTILENSLEMKHAVKHQSRPLKDDRNILQLISAGIQVAKILNDASAMNHLDQLYISTEKKIQQRTQHRFCQGTLL